MDERPRVVGVGEDRSTERAHEPLIGPRRHRAQSGERRDNDDDGIATLDGGVSGKHFVNL
jgi:hypothetical protein